MKKIKYLLPIVAFLLFSCSDYLDINNSPNNLTKDKVSPDLALAAAQTRSYTANPGNMNRLGNFFMNNWGINVNSFAATSPQEFSLSIDSGFYGAIWDGIYFNTANYSNIINSAFENYENHKAIAKIMKAYHFQYLVDIYGDIPYFQAHTGFDDVTPAYDDDQAIYRDLVVQLDAAIATIDAPLASTIAVGAEDVIMGGNMANWKKFANTLKLRILMRQSNLALTDAATATYLTTQFATLASATFITDDVTINPGYTNGDPTRQNPFYSRYFQTDGSQKDEFRYIRASKYMGDILNSTGDNRAGRLFDNNTVDGVLQGDLATINSGTAPLAITGLGTGIVNSATQDGYIMLLAESLLLQAEAVHRGYLTGSAQALFDQAIASSFTQLGAAGSAAYIGSINTVAGKGYGTGTPAQQIESIMYQKNIALQGGVNAMESFIEYTRTGLIDAIPLAISGVTKPNKPRRLLYPTSELVGNTANVPSQTVNSVFVTGPFWRP